MTIELTTLLMVHFLCNAQAAVVPATAQDAIYCVSNFEALKLRLHDGGVTPEELGTLTESERTKLSVEAYGSYRKWLAENPAMVRKLRDMSVLMAFNTPE